MRRDREVCLLAQGHSAVGGKAQTSPCLPGANITLVYLLLITLALPPWGAGILAQPKPSHYPGLLAGQDDFLLKEA